MSEVPPIPQPVQQNWKHKWLPSIIAALLVAIGIGEKLGYLTPEQGDSLKKIVTLVVAENQKAVEEVQVEAAKKDAAQDKRLDDIAKLIQQLIDSIQKKPTPTPGPQPPTPVPPADEGLRISLTDETGKLIPSMNVESGQLFRVVATGAAGPIGWQPVKHGDVKLVACSDSNEWCGYLTPGSWVDFGLTDFGARKQLQARVTCNQGPQPPPVPAPDEKPQPQPPKPPEGPRQLSLNVVHDVGEITPATAIVLNATDTWNGFITSYSCDWMFYDVADDTAEAERVRQNLVGVPPPALVVFDKRTGKHVQTLPLPKTVDALVSTVASMVRGS